jgi:hypothetical protein
MKTVVKRIGKHLCDFLFTLLLIVGLEYAIERYPEIGGLELDVTSQHLVCADGVNLQGDNISIIGSKEPQ